MLRSLAIAAAAIVALGAAQPSEAASTRRTEARSAGKATGAAARPVASRAEPSRRVVAGTPARARATARVASRGGRSQARVASRRQVAVQSGRSNIRLVSLFSGSAHASTLSARGGKVGKAARAQRSQGRMGVWHAGLPAADGEQMDCPSGTMAVLARGHSDTFRCMPM
jgi:hypothetical protein